MKIDFNNLRVQSAQSLDKLIRVLNNSTLNERHVVMEKDEDGNLKEGDILVKLTDIKDIVEDLRYDISMICACSQPGDDDARDVSDEVKKNGGIRTLNEK